MGGLAIVAIPAADDRVWKVSSEKVPHLTMLFLGDQVSPEDTQSIVQFVEHLSNGSLTRFGLDVDRRDTLGDEGADVLLFRKKGPDMRSLSQVRGYMLANDVIKKAFDATPQFPSWTPHVTLGFPDSPANKMTEEFDSPIYWVRFDKLAVWTGDYDGPEFDLPDPYEKMYDDGGAPAALGWSAMFDTPVSELAHYGVKGMRWGIRRRDQEAGTAAKRAPVPSADKQRAAAAEAQIKKGDTSALSNQDLQQLVTRMNLEQQYSRLASQSATVNRGTKKAKTIIETANTGKTAYNLVASTAIGKRVGRVLRAAAISAAVSAGKIYYKSRG